MTFPLSQLPTELPLSLSYLPNFMHIYRYRYRYIPSPHFSLSFKKQKTKKLKIHTCSAGFLPTDNEFLSTLLFLLLFIWYPPAKVDQASFIQF